MQDGPRMRLGQRYEWISFLSTGPKRCERCERVSQPVPGSTYAIRTVSWILTQKHK